MRRPFSSQRWPLVFANGGGERGWSVGDASRGSRGRRRAALVTGLALVSAGVALAAGGAFALDGMAAAGSVVAAAMILVGAIAVARAARARRRTTRPSGAWLEARDAGLHRVTPEVEKAIVSWDGPFGVTLLASYGRAWALLAFTSPSQTRYVPVRLDGRTDEDDSLFAQVAVLADLDLVDGIMHDAALSAADAASVVRLAEKKSPESLGRVHLSDGRGAPITLDRATLSVGDRAFDLTSSLEWRPLMFHESTGQAAALYQATWIRQSGSELVLVAPMPASIVPREIDAQKAAAGRLGRTLTRGLKLLQAPAEAPPARDARVAIDRPFMMAVRRALDEAPLARRIPGEPVATDASRRPRVERRA